MTFFVPKTQGMDELDPKTAWSYIVAIILTAFMSWVIYKAVKLANGDLDDGDVGRKEGFAELHYPWMRVESLENVRSLYHAIEVIDTKRPDLGKCLLLNDEVQFCSAEEAKYHELIVHYGVQYLTNAGPQKVLIIGGGDCMVLREVMKYAGVKVDVLELDDMVTRVVEKHFGADRMAKNDRVKWTFGNIRASVRNLILTSRQQYDFIVDDTTETTDHNAETDTVSFFEDVRDLLTPNGVLVKNGDTCDHIMRKSFAYTMTYGYDSKTHDARYSFVLGASFDFKQKIVTTGRWFQHNVKTTAYNPDKHFEYIKWTDAYKQTLLDRIVTVLPSLSPIPTITPPIPPTITTTVTPRVEEEPEHYAQPVENRR